MRKIIISLLIMVLMSSMVFAVSRSISGTTVTYSTTVIPSTNLPKAYWAVEDMVNGCIISSISCSVTNGDCSYIGGSIRVVGYTAEAGGSMPSIIAVSVLGTGACSLNGNWVESYNDGVQAVIGSSQSVGSDTMSLGIECNTDADTNCDGTVADMELLSYANLWMAGSISDMNLLQVANAWIGG